MAYKVLVPVPVDPCGLDYLRERGHEVVMGTSNSFEDMSREIADCDALLARQGNFTAALFQAAPRLKVIGVHGIGLNNIDVEGATNLGIQVTNAPQSNRVSVAEHAIMLLLALAKDIFHIDCETRKGNWACRHAGTSKEVSGKVLGIVGLGRIGRTVAEKAMYGLEMKVIGYDEYLTEDDVLPDGIERTFSLEDLFSRSDFISLHVPLTPQTNGMVSSRLLRLMKPTAFLINCARGQVVNEQDLYLALSEGWIKGAGLDCLAEEPAKPDNPIFKLNNVIVDAHCAAQTAEAIQRMSLHAAIGIDEVLSGKKPTWPANRL